MASIPNADGWSDVRFDERERHQIIEILGETYYDAPKGASERIPTVRFIEEAAHRYLILDREDGAAASTRDLRSELRNLDRLDRDPSERLPPGVSDAALALIGPRLNFAGVRNALETAEKPQGSGARRKLARRQRVDDLAWLFEAATGKRPTRRVDADDGQEHGPFLELVTIVLGAIDPSAVKGIEAEVRRVAAGSRTRSASC